MGEPDTEVEVAETIKNESNPTEHICEIVNEKKGEANGGITEMEEDPKADPKVDNIKMDDDTELKEDDTGKQIKNDEGEKPIVGTKEEKEEAIVVPEKEKDDIRAETEEKNVEAEIETEEKNVDAEIETEEKSIEAEIETKEENEDCGVEPNEKNEDSGVETNERNEDSRVEPEEKDEDSRIKAMEKDEDPKVNTKEGKEDPEVQLMEEDTHGNEIEVIEELKQVDEAKEEEEKEEEEEIEDEKEKRIEVEKGSKKRGRKKSSEKVGEKKNKLEEKEPEQRTPVTDRPVRERKSVERLVASIERDSGKEFHIQKGRGTPLKDIPNVAFKLSRKKSDDTFKLLHTILFGRRGKAFQVKSNISRFSGFVWQEKEEKQRNKVKEKFDKCTKEKLLEFCDVLDIPVAKATTRKEDIITKLIEFLVAPHPTTTVLLAEREQSSKGQKRKRGVKSSSSTPGSNDSNHSSKSRRKGEDTSKSEVTKDLSDTGDESEEEKESDEENEERYQNGSPEKPQDDMHEDSESEKQNDPTDESEEEKPKRRSKSSSRKKETTGKSRSKKIVVSPRSSPPSKRTAKKASKSSTVDEDEISPKVFSRKRSNEKVKGSATTPKTVLKEKVGRKGGKGKDKRKEEKLRLTDDELRDAICEILKEVDFNTATFTDILKQLANRYKTDLTPRKSSIKLMIQEELTKLADEADDEEEEDEEEEEAGGGKAERQAKGQEVET